MDKAQKAIELMDEMDEYYGDGCHKYAYMGTLQEWRKFKHKARVELKGKLKKLRVEDAINKINKVIKETNCYVDELEKDLCYIDNRVDKLEDRINKLCKTNFKRKSNG